MICFMSREFWKSFNTHRILIGTERMQFSKRIPTHTRKREKKRELHWLKAQIFLSFWNNLSNFILLQLYTQIIATDHWEKCTCAITIVLQMTKKLLANAGDAGSTPGQEDPLEKGPFCASVLSYKMETVIELLHRWLWSLNAFVYIYSYTYYEECLTHCKQYTCVCCYPLLEICLWKQSIKHCHKNVV